MVVVISEFIVVQHYCLQAKEQCSILLVGHISERMAQVASSGIHCSRTVGLSSRRADGRLQASGSVHPGYSHRNGLSPGGVLECLLADSDC
jgi:hypothetical protein